MHIPSLPNLPTLITLTGVDDSTDIDALVDLSKRYPLVEWGILYSPKRVGCGGRYPSLATIKHILNSLPAENKVALHLCGMGTPYLLAGSPIEVALVKAVSARAGRIQLNFNHKRAPIDLPALGALLNKFLDVTVITQYNTANEDVWKNLIRWKNHAVLFDSSGGNGVECKAWPSPISGVSCGYAGGLGPDNLAEELPRIGAAANTRPYWVDMQGKLRTSEDAFDLNLAESCLQIFTAFAAAINTVG